MASSCSSGLNLAKSWQLPCSWWLTWAIPGRELLGSWESSSRADSGNTESSSLSSFWFSRNVSSFCTRPSSLLRVICVFSLGCLSPLSPLRSQLAVESELLEATSTSQARVMLSLQNCSGPSCVWSRLARSLPAFSVRHDPWLGGTKLTEGPSAAESSQERVFAQEEMSSQGKQPTERLRFDSELLEKERTVEFEGSNLRSPSSRGSSKEKV